MYGENCCCNRSCCGSSGCSNRKKEKVGKSTNPPSTVLSMIPMALALGHSGKMVQGLAIVNAGGLAAYAVLSLLMLPVYCSVMRKRAV